MSGLHQSRIEWCDSTFNPISGCLGPRGTGDICPYCYAARQVRRFEPKASEWPEEGTVHAATHDPRCYIAEKPTALRDADGKYLRSTPYPKGFAPTIHAYKLAFLKSAEAPRRIFIGSMADVFGEWIPDAWIIEIFKTCREAPQHVYMFLTKNPARYFQLARDGLLPEGDNYWYGTTTPTTETPFFYSDKHKTFTSIEPLLGPFEPISEAVRAPDWIIVGAMTGIGAKKHRPKREWLDGIFKMCADREIPLFTKNNILDCVWGEERQEIPAAMTEHLKKICPVDWQSLEVHKIFLERVREPKVCRQCTASVQGKPAWRLSGRYYICESCYKGGGNA